MAITMSKAVFGLILGLLLWHAPVHGVDKVRIGRIECAFPNELGDLAGGRLRTLQKNKNAAVNVLKKRLRMDATHDKHIEKTYQRYPSKYFDNVPYVSIQGSRHCWSS